MLFQTQAAESLEYTSRDHLWRATALKVRGGGVPLSIRGLSSLRKEAAKEAFESRRETACELWQRIESGDASAKAGLAALTEDALADMRQRVKNRAQSDGLVTTLLAMGDAWWRCRDNEELLDDPALDVELRQWIMASLDTVNNVLDSYNHFFEAMRPLVEAKGPTRVLDLAAGHGGFVRAAARIAQTEGLDIHFTASDIKREYLDMGEALAQKEGLDVDFVVQDALDLSNLEPGAFDIVVCTQSVHHFPPGLVSLMFREATQVAKRGVVFVDVCRSLLAGAGAIVFGTLRLRNPGWTHDAWVSLRRCHVPEELELLARFSLLGDEVQSKWIAPGYCLLRWQRPSAVLT